MYKNVIPSCKTTALISPSCMIITISHSKSHCQGKGQNSWNFSAVLGFFMRRQRQPIYILQTNIETGRGLYLRGSCFQVILCQFPQSCLVSGGMKVYQIAQHNFFLKAVMGYWPPALHLYVCSRTLAF